MEVILARGTAPLSKLIMLLTGGSFSHTALRYGGADSEWIVHAFIYGVVPEWYSYFQAHYEAIKRFKVIRYEAEAEKALDLVVMRYRHRSYDYGALFGYALALLLGKIGITIKPPFGNRKAFMCTELIAEWLVEFSKQAELCMPDLRNEVATPKAIELLFLSWPDVFKPLEDQNDSIQ